MTIKIHPSLKNFVRPSPHSAFSPSSIDRWIACPASVKLSKGIPEEPESPWAREGTLAHAVCEATFRNLHYGVPYPVDLQLDLVKFDKDNGGGSDEMFHHASSYAEVIVAWLNDKERVGDVLWFGLERGIPIIPEEGCFGTADCVIVGSKGSVVIDYKYGKGKAVKAETPQLKAYAAGVARYLSGASADYKVHAVVFQPRTDFDPKHTCYEYSELLNFLDHVYGAIEESKKEGLSPIDGNHCFWCPARRTKDINLKCPVIRDAPIKAAQENFGKFLADMQAPVKSLADPNPNRDAAMLKIMALAPMINQLAKDAEEEFTFRIEKGEHVEGVALVQKAGSRKYNAESDADAAKMIEETLGVDPWKVINTKKLRTITEIEKEVGKGKLDSITYKPLKKALVILDEKTRDILGELSRFSISGDNTEE